MRTIDLSPVVVIGTGLVGASVGCALTAAGVRVHLSDAVPSHAWIAASRGAGTLDPVPPDDVRLVVVAVPPAALAEVIADALTHYSNATVTDVGSVKGTVVADLRARPELRGRRTLARYCGSHPMAGSHAAGPLTARADLFTDRTWIVAPHDTASAHAVLDVAELGRLCGARLVTLGVGHHDEAVAEVSHVPHLLSVVMGGQLNDVPPEHLKLAGQGLRDVTRISGGDPGLWWQIIAANREAVRALLTDIRHSLTELMEILDSPERSENGELERFLDWGRSGTRLIPGKHGSAGRDFAHVVIEIPDAPGALARLFTDIGAAGFNVEDLSIEHDPDREIGWLSVQVAPERAGDLAATMEQAGWTVRR